MMRSEPSSPDIYAMPEVWDQQAVDYEAFAHPLTRQFAEQALILSGGVSPGEQVLDIAAGTGALTLTAAKAGAQVTGIDFSKGMVALLNARLAEGGFHSSKAHVMDGQALDLADEAFDAAFSIFGVVLFPDWRAGLAELGRVVRPGGRGCIAVWTQAAGAGPALAMDAAYRASFPDRPPPNPAPGLLVLKSPDALISEMSRVGFTNVDVHPVTGVWQADSPARALEQVECFFSRFPAYAELSARERGQMREALGDEFDRHMVEGQVTIPSEAYVATGVKVRTP